MTDERLDSVTMLALVGADQLDDDALALALANAIDRVIIAVDDLGSRAQDLRELAAVCLVVARRLEGGR